MIMIRKILGRYIIGNGIVPFLGYLIRQMKRLEIFMFNQQMDIYYHYKDRQDTEFLNHIKLQQNYFKNN
mgnify:CR=1 FL=1